MQHDIWVVLCALPWFFFEKRRPGLALPPGSSLLTIGFRQTYIALRECMRLKQTFLYLIFYFLMYVSYPITWDQSNDAIRGDVLNTTVLAS
jgi:MFS-type transporter involved in bile tolerance (Atg22 family)